MILVLDSWIVLAWLKDQAPGSDRMSELWNQAETGRVQLMISILNLGEIFYLSAKARGEAAAHTILRNLRKRPLEVISASDDLVLHAATLKARHAISYADAFAAATAIHQGAPLVTRDPEMLSLASEGLRLEWID